jgi:hypothetical protein
MPFRSKDFCLKAVFKFVHRILGDFDIGTGLVRAFYFPKKAIEPADMDEHHYERLMGEVDSSDENTQDGRGTSPRSQACNWRSLLIGTVVGFALNFLVFHL